MADQVVLPPSIEDVPPPGLALVEELDKLLLVQVRRRCRRRCLRLLPALGCCDHPCARCTPSRPLNVRS